LTYHTQKNLPISRAIRKDKIENFTLFISAFTTKNNVYLMEQNYIDELNPAYNVCKTVGQKYNISIKRNPMSDEQRLKLSLKKGKANHRYGIKHTKEALIKMRDNHPNTKPIYQIKKH